MLLLIVSLVMVEQRRSWLRPTPVRPSRVSGPAESCARSRRVVSPARPSRVSGPAESCPRSGRVVCPVRLGPGPAPAVPLASAGSGSSAAGCSCMPRPAGVLATGSDVTPTAPERCAAPAPLPPPCLGHPQLCPAPATPRRSGPRVSRADGRRAVLAAGQNGAVLVLAKLHRAEPSCEWHRETRPEMRRAGACRWCWFRGATLSNRESPPVRMCCMGCLPTMVWIVDTCDVSVCGHECVTLNKQHSAKLVALGRNAETAAALGWVLWSVLLSGIIDVGVPSEWGRSDDHLVLRSCGVGG